ncbi:sensor histidine kinase [Mycoplasma sp. P36-A1]|uniref:sensor histidine kinase n=1 Tax=Mycoplasma sp. P36-A1 TaxID=3252900 RepID=UPI003C30D731
MNNTKQDQENIKKMLLRKTIVRLIRAYIILGLFLLFIYYITPVIQQYAANKSILTYTILKNIYYKIFYVAGPLSLFIITSYILVTSLYKCISYIENIKKVTSELLSDNTIRHKLPVELNELQLIIDDINESINTNKAIAAESLERKNELMVYLAHDLKTPLTSIKGYLQLLKEEELEIEVRDKYIDIVNDKSDRLETLINEFFELSRLSLSMETLVKTNINLSLLLEQLSFEYIPIFASKNIKLRQTIQENIYVEVDSNKLQRALDNILSNAVSYAFPNSTVDIILSTDYLDDSIIKILLINEGQTIAKEKLKKFFDPFYRGDQSRTTYTGGAGLGLAISKEIINIHKGSIDVESYDNKIVFSITLKALK